ncbi:hypothetical protein GA0004736_3631 [Curtobacterium sp. 9128]|uniref:hypothetical protein n=1 Tax=Curtobacterium sp. 9128 TaxID=1793722 RepID=UPI0007D729AB|nr:hypothetical protein [Curtobacterium sp. 9128]SBN64668.1 hypothetical protein GA0004736_3631 [Curtobacterium sp. 9128]
MTVVAEAAAMRALEDLDDGELGAQLLRGVPTNELRSDEELLRHAARATAFGTELAGSTAGSTPSGSTASGSTAGSTPAIVEHDGGLDAALLAQYDSRHHRIDLFTDTIAFCERLVDELGWRHLFPVGSVRAAAVEHERAHHLVTADRSRGLRAALDHQVFRLGRFRRLAYIAGTDEVAAHAFAARSLGLTRSPLLLTRAATAAIRTRNDARSASNPKEN